MHSFWLSLSRVLCLAPLILSLATPSDAYAQSSKKAKASEDIDDEDEDLGASQGSSKNAPSLVEVARGFYMKSDPGFMDYLGTVQANPAYYPFGYGDSWSVGFRYVAGYDLYTSNRLGLSVEGLYEQTTSYNSPWDGSNPATPGFMTLGHFRSHMIEVVARPTALLGPKGRFNLYARAGAGATFLQLHRSVESIPSAQQDLLQYYSSLKYGVHPLPYVVLGGGLEYYTRLSHFSFTFAEVNYYAVLGFDNALSVQFAGFKYTF